MSLKENGSLQSMVWLSVVHTEADRFFATGRQPVSLGVVEAQMEISVVQQTSKPAARAPEALPQASKQ